jgi:hypothetical protein
MYTIATLTALRQHLGLSSSDTSDDARLLGALQAASAQIERAAARHFCPRLASIEHSVSRYDTLYLTLREDLLSLTTLIDGDDTSISLSEVILAPQAMPPYSMLYLANGRAFVRNPLNPILVTGTWGWHDRPTEMWRTSSDTVQNNPLTSSATTLTVSNASGSDSFGQSPRLQVGHLLLIDSEYLRVLAINSNSLTVLRGVNGTTAASHTLNTPIYTFQPVPDVQLLTLRWAAWLYREGDTDSPPQELRESLSELRRAVVKV